MREFIKIVESESNLLTKDVTLKGGVVGVLEVTPNSYGLDVGVTVDGEYCGGVRFGENSWANMTGTWSATSAFVNKEWQRMGVATVCYDAMEELGHTVVPEPRYHKRSPDAEKFWADRRAKRA